jgi:hypothetical protein
MLWCLSELVILFVTNLHQNLLTEKDEIKNKKSGKFR